MRLLKSGPRAYDEWTMRPLLAVIVGALLTASACSAPVSTTSAVCPSPGPVAGLTRIEGLVMAPLALYVRAGSLHPTAPYEQVPVPGGRIRLTDVGGHAIPGLEGTEADEHGRFVLPDVPAGHAYVLEAAFSEPGGATVRLKTLVQTKEGVMTVGFGAASTILAEALTRDRRGLLAPFDEAAFQRAAVALSQGLTNGNLPDFRRPSTFTTALDAWTTGNPELAEAIGVLRQALAANPPRPSPTPTPTPVPTRTPRDDDDDDDGPTPVPAAAWETTITIQDFLFRPAEVRVRQYGSVQFINQDIAPHAVVPLEEDAITPTTGVIEAGTMAQPVRFPEAGTYTFTSDAYPAMRGTIIVVPGPAPTPEPNPTP